jgi:hypothetical protein
MNLVKVSLLLGLVTICLNEFRLPLVEQFVTQSSKFAVIAVQHKSNTSVSLLVRKYL